MGPLTSMQVVGIAGPDGAGKSTLSSHLISLLSDRFYPVRVPFAEPLRHELKAILDWDGRNNDWMPDGWHVDPWEKPTSPWMRSLLRGWGDYKRSVDPRYWVAAWEAQLAVFRQSQKEKTLLVVADDLRYVNELVAVQHQGGTVLYLDDVGVADHTLMHELVEVRSMADLGFTINSRAGMWADPEMVLEALEL